MNVNNVNLECVAVKHEQYPKTGLPEIAFVGRSNVGKSSLINTMVNRKALARTSQNPGKTRTINFYNVENKLYFVDLPGYGYAKTSQSLSQTWGAMIEKYLLKRQELKAIVMLLDIRHTPTANDKMLYDWLVHYGYNIIFVATKSDKINRSALSKHISIIRKALNLTDKDTIVPFSSLAKQGKENLWDIIEERVGLKEEVKD